MGVVLLAGCARPASPSADPPLVAVGEPPLTGRGPRVSSVASGTPSPRDPVAPAPAVEPPRAVWRERYPWLGDTPAARMPAAVEELRARFEPPSGFARREAPDGSFGAWLAHLPLAAKDTPVLTFEGRELHPASHPNVAAVVAIDVGTADLQQCADSVIRLHAEWSWAAGKREAIAYRAAAGVAMPWSRWAQGERLVPEGRTSLGWTLGGKPASDHATFRKYLDAVFAWANTVSLAKEAQKLDVGDVAAGDFVVQPGNPGHAVLVLDVAIDATGRRAALLGQGYMPAQSFHVLRPDRGALEELGGAWFLLDPAAEGVKTPFWPLFPWSSLRRLAR